MRCLIYRSRARSSWSPGDLAGLLEQARSNNAAREVTGCLLYAARNFLQLLEGPDDAVLETFAKISRDSRHTEVTELLNADRAVPTFNAWWMAFFNLDHDTELSEKLQRDIEQSLSSIDQNPLAIHQVFQRFRAELGTLQSD